jgi:ferritin-like metal-binding protein YciE
MAESLDSLRALYLESLRDLHSAERQIAASLPRMIEAAHSKELCQALETHLRLTQEHAERLESLFHDLGESAEGHECLAMKGLVAEADRMSKMHGDPDVRDAGLITAAQRIEHYEIAGYGCSRTFARLLDYHDHAELLQATLDEEADADEILTDLAEGLINQRALKAHRKGYAG